MPTAPGQGAYLAVARDAVDGRCASRLQRDRLAPGRHMFPLPGVGRMHGLLFVVSDFSGARGPQRMILRTLATAP